MSAGGQVTRSAMQPALTYEPPASRARTQHASHRGWIHSPAFDLALFTLAPIAGLLVLWANANMRGGIWIMTGALYFVAIPHYLASFTFFLGDDNREYYRSRRAAFRRPAAACSCLCQAWWRWPWSDWPRRPRSPALR